MGQLLALAGMLAVFPGHTQSIFINEIHYDDASGDSGEGVEIAGPAGTDLTGWTIVPYNGNGGTSYTPIGSAAGTIPDLGGGFGTVFVAISGLQNGAPDGLALVDNANTVIQFLSYEGSFTAVGGPADGLLSTDIGVSESGSVEGQSLQLTGNGSVYTDFTWAAEAASTYGAFNNGQTFVGGGPSCGITLGAESTVCNSTTAGPGNDTYDLSIPYTGVDAGTTVVNNSGSGSVGGDDPAVVTDGTIVISGISEDDAYSVTFTSPCDALTVSGAAPSCEPPFAGTIINFDDDLLWTAGSAAITSYATDHTYVDSDWTFTGGPALRQGTTAQDGFPGAFGTYAWRLQNVTNVDWRATYNGSEVIDAFGFSVRRWDGTPSPAFEVSFSTDGGSSFGAAVQVIENTYLNNSSDWTVFSYTIPAPAAVAPGQFVVRVAATGTTERIMIDDFTFESSAPPPVIVINEIRTDQSGADNDEYFELAGPAGTSLDGLTYIVIGDGAGGSGVIESVSDLTGSTIPASGFFLAAEGTFTLGTADLITTLNFENGDNVTHLLVADFTGANGDDLDTDDDGVLDVTPWSSVVSSVAVLATVGSGDLVYSTDQVGPDGGFAPAHVYRCSTVWFIGPFDIVGGQDSPGLDNPNCSCAVVFQAESATCNSQTAGPGNDTYDLSIPYSGVQAGVTVINNSGSGSLGGDDPAVTPNGTIVISGISEDDNYDVALSAPCALVTLTGQAPVCEPAIDYTVLVINEVDYDQDGTDTDEFVEIKNTGAVDVNLGGVQLQLINGNGGTPYTTIVLNNVVLQAGDYYVVGSATVPNVDQVAWVDNGIQNGAPDGLLLLDPSNNVLDGMSYEGDITGVTEGSGAGLEDSTFGLPAYNSFSLSRFPDGVDTDQNNVDFLVKCITPGATNSPQDDFCICQPATASVSTVCIDDFTFNVVVDITDLGSSSALFISEDLNFFSDLAFGPGQVVLGPFNNDDVTNVTISHDNTLCDGFYPGLTDDCAPPPPCFDNEVELRIDTDTWPEEITWQIVPQGGGTPVCSGGPYGGQSLTTLLEQCCLPDGCYELLVFDQFGDGIDDPGGYVLRDPNGERIIDNLPSGDFGNLSTILNNGGFCVPLGPVTLYEPFCDREDLASTATIRCNPNGAVSAQFGVTNATSGYQWRFFDPNGTYLRNIFVSHANPSDPGKPAGAGRATWLRFQSIVTLPLPQNTPLNVQVRPRVNGTYGNFGPVCRLVVDDAAAGCPTTTLVQDPNSQNFSCGVQRVFGPFGNTIVAQPVLGANRYRFRFEQIGDAFVRNIAIPSYALILNWGTLPLTPGASYNVFVQVSFDGGANYCPFGAPCVVDIINPPSASTRELTGEAGGVLNLWPNPNRGDQLYLTLSELPAEELTVNVDIHDLFGKRVAAHTVLAQGGTLNTVIALDGQFAAGMYLVNITAGEQRFTERLVIE